MLQMKRPLKADPSGVHRNLRIYIIRLKLRLIGLHFAADNINLSSLEFLRWAPYDNFISAREVFQPFKDIQVH